MPRGVAADLDGPRAGAEAHEEYDLLMALAVMVHRLPCTESTSEVHMAASEFMIGIADEQWALWDGKPARA